MKACKSFGDCINFRNYASANLRAILLLKHPFTFFLSAIACCALPKAERKNIVARQRLPSETNIDAATIGARHTTDTVGFIEKINLVVNKAAESGVGCCFASGSSGIFPGALLQ